MRIQLMPAVLANQIAAGEVIERPAQVVKELIENSFDSGATEIQIDIQGGGKDKIQISDNGAGIIEEDLLLAVAPHATSKISSLNDLLHITSFGFRGEALACISSVSRLTITSKPATQNLAYSLSFDADNSAHIKPAAHPNGTTICVRDLFQKIPVRRKFLRRDQTEFDHVFDVVKRAALSRFDVGITFTQQEKTIVRLPPAILPKQQLMRVKKLLGSQFVANALEIKCECEGLSVYGWIASNYTRTQSDLQYCYVNGRWVRDSVISHAIRRAYGDSILPGRYPCFIIYLQCPPDSVDVNVHPTKQEVRFRQPRWIHDFIYRAVQPALTGDPTTTARFEAFSEHELQTPPDNRDMALQADKAVLPNVIGYLHERYALVEENLSLLVIDLQTLLQAHAYLETISNLQNQSLIAKPLFIPKRYVFPKNAMDWILANSELWQTVCVEVTPLDDQTIVIRALPESLKLCDFSLAVSKLMALSTNELSKKIICLHQCNQFDLKAAMLLPWWQYYQNLTAHPNLHDQFHYHRRCQLQDILP